MNLGKLQTYHNPSGKSYEVLRLKETFPRKIPPPGRGFYEIDYFLSGNVVYVAGQNRYKLENGDILLTSPGEFNQLRIDDGLPYERWLMRVSPRYIGLLSTANTDLTAAFDRTGDGDRFRRLPKRISVMIAALLEETAALQNSQAFGDDLLCRMNVAKILLCLCSRPPPSPPETVTAKRTTIRSVVDYIDANYVSPDLNLKQIAASHYLSESRLSHLFKENTGYSIYHYIIKKRLARARDLLRRGVSVTEVYAACGFKNYYGFYRAFKNEFGVTPKYFFNGGDENDPS